MDIIQLCDVIVQLFSHAIVVVYKFNAGASVVPCIHVNIVCRPTYARLHSRQEGAYQAACQRSLQAAHVPLLVSQIQGTLRE